MVNPTASKRPVPAIHTRDRNELNVTQLLRKFRQRRVLRRRQHRPGRKSPSLALQCPNAGPILLNRSWPDEAAAKRRRKRARGRRRRGHVLTDQPITAFDRRNVPAARVWSCFSPACLVAPIAAFSVLPKDQAGTLVIGLLTVLAVIGIFALFRLRRRIFAVLRASGAQRSDQAHLRQRAGRPHRHRRRWQDPLRQRILYAASLARAMRAS